MQAYETSATVGGKGVISLTGVPFEPGTEVEVIISPRRGPSADFAESWQRVCRQLRAPANLEGLSDDEIQKEIEAYRAGR